MLNSPTVAVGTNAYSVPVLPQLYDIIMDSPLPDLPPLPEPAPQSNDPPARQSSPLDVDMTTDISQTVPATATTNERPLTRQTSCTFTNATTSAPSTLAAAKKGKGKEKAKPLEHPAEDEAAVKNVHDAGVYKRLDLAPPASGESVPAYRARESDNLYKVAAKTIALEDKIALFEADFKSEKLALVTTTQEIHLICEERRIQAERIESALVTYNAPNITENPLGICTGYPAGFLVAPYPAPCTGTPRRPAGSPRLKAYQAVAALKDKVAVMESSFGAIEDTISTLSSAVDNLSINSSSSTPRSAANNDDLPALPPLPSVPPSPTKRTAAAAGLDVFPPRSTPAPSVTTPPAPSVTTPTPALAIRTNGTGSTDVLFAPYHNNSPIPPREAAVGILRKLRIGIKDFRTAYRSGRYPNALVIRTADETAARLVVAAISPDIRPAEMDDATAVLLPPSADVFDMALLAGPQPQPVAGPSSLGYAG
ncbi:hypothetical protein V5O48_014214 [Marasmius crinis-equi]|uniref:Uncharacterized protein n=1 Tax=Marasmius crinis-equi TaxID=585013 RepID=A0ABR3EXY6_9AGAR